MNIKWGLDSIRHLIEALDHPENDFSAIHVAGTNGKGSTCAMLESILRHAGYKTGLFTSPHLIDVRERIKVDGTEIKLSVIKEYLEFLLPTIMKHGCSFFEILTAIAFAHFRDQKIDMGIVETGMGGRLDATNIITPKMSVITEIDLDHVKTLGSTYLKIAGEKAGIIKEGVPVLSSATKREVLDFYASFCKKRKSEFTDAFAGTQIHDIQCSSAGCRFGLTTPENHWHDVHLSLLGRHQINNAVAAIRITEKMNQQFFTNRKAIYDGLRSVEWRGRLQILQENPMVLVDAAHNPQSIRFAINEISRIFTFQRMICVFGVLADKDISGMLDSMNSCVDEYVTVAPQNERAKDPNVLARELRNSGKPVSVGDTITAGLTLALSRAEANDLICVLGSHFIIGEVMKYYKKT